MWVPLSLYFWCADFCIETYVQSSTATKERGTLQNSPISFLIKGKWWKHLVHFTVDCTTVTTFSTQATIGTPSQNRLGSIFFSCYNFVVNLIFPEMSVQECRAVESASSCQLTSNQVSANFCAELYLAVVTP